MLKHLKKQIRMTSKFRNLIDSKLPVLVVFHAAWCEPCKNLGGILEQVKSELRDDIKIIKIDVDKNNLLAANYQVRGVPTSLLFKNGIQVWRHSGIKHKNELIHVVRTH